MRTANYDDNFSDSRPLVFFEDLRPGQIALLMTVKDLTVEQIVKGRISPENSDDRRKLSDTLSGRRQRLT